MIRYFKKSKRTQPSPVRVQLRVDLLQMSVPCALTISFRAAVHARRA